ncbi:MAG: hypothetical protein AAF420_10860 [Pseudomonadota bacterium]
MTKKPIKALFQTLAGLACLGASGFALADGHTPSFHGDVTIRLDDNVTRAQYERDIEEDTVGSVLGQIDYLQQLNETSGLIYSASAEAEKFATFEDLDNLNIKLSANYKWHLGYGFYSPRVAFSAAYTLRDFVNEQRTGSGFELGASMTRRFSENIIMTGGLRLRSFEGDSDVFSVDDTSAFLNVDFAITPRIALYTTVRLIVGDVVSTAEPSLDIINASDAIEPDEAFGGFRTNRFVYRLDADTTTLTVGGNYALDNKSSIDASLLYIDTQASGGFYYERLQYRASYLRRF